MSKPDTLLKALIFALDGSRKLYCLKGANLSRSEMIQIAQMMLPEMEAYLIQDRMIIIEALKQTMKGVIDCPRCEKRHLEAIHKEIEKAGGAS